MKYLLDTHILIWMIADSGRLSRKALKALEDLRNTLYFSPVMLNEIAIKHSKHPQEMPFTASEILDLAEEHGVLELPFRARHGVAVAELPDIHGDPFDRMLIAQAHADEMSLITHDDTRFFKKHGEKVYNPVSINLNLAKCDDEFAYYWTQTGRSSMLMNLIKRGDMCAIDPERVTAATDKAFDVSDLRNLKPVFLSSGKFASFS